MQKKNIEVVQGVDVYPAVQQMLIHQGEVLKDESTLEENQVAENSFVVVVLSKSKVATAASSAPSNPAAQAASSVPPPSSTPQPPASTARQGDSSPVQVPVNTTSLTSQHDFLIVGFNNFCNLTVSSSIISNFTFLSTSRNHNINIKLETTLHAPFNTSSSAFFIAITRHQKSENKTQKLIEREEEKYEEDTYLNLWISLHYLEYFVETIIVNRYSKIKTE
ncbi:hypothetical protein RYX36_003458 [Vicia faba]